jgi:hypothetical protein
LKVIIPSVVRGASGENGGGCGGHGVDSIRCWGVVKRKKQIYFG